MSLKEMNSRPLFIYVVTVSWEIVDGVVPRKEAMAV